MEAAELAIYKRVQEKSFIDVMSKLRKDIPLTKKHPLMKLSPFIDDVGILRVGGRLANSFLLPPYKYPLILPKSSRIVRLLIEETHRRNGHLGREAILAKIKQKFHLIGAIPLIKDILRKCLICRRIHGKPEMQLLYGWIC